MGVLSDAVAALVRLADALDRIADGVEKIAEDVQIVRGTVPPDPRPDADVS